MKGSNPARHLLFLLPVLSTHLSATTLVPDWNGDPLSTSANYVFTTSSRTAPPESFVNPFGTPSLLVEDEQFFGTGWQDPNGVFQLTRVAAEGAWDLGQAGRLSIDIPVSALGDTSPKDLHVFVNFIWYLGPVGSPSVQLVGHSPTTQSLTSEFVEADGAGSWRRTIWQATFDDYTGDSILLRLQAPTNGSVVDSVAAYTLIPEPSGALMIALALGGLVFLRRRS